MYVHQDLANSFTETQLLKFSIGAGKVYGSWAVRRCDINPFHSTPRKTSPKDRNNRYIDRKK